MIQHRMVAWMVPRESRPATDSRAMHHHEMTLNILLQGTLTTHAAARSESAVYISFIHFYHAHLSEIFHSPVSPHHPRVNQFTQQAHSFAQVVFPSSFTHSSRRPETLDFAATQTVPHFHAPGVRTYAASHRVTPSLSLRTLYILPLAGPPPLRRVCVPAERTLCSFQLVVVARFFIPPFRARAK
jgi:hypothetical protein